jgi:hypothetical protein
MHPFHLPRHYRAAYHVVLMCRQGVYYDTSLSTALFNHQEITSRAKNFCRIVFASVVHKNWWVYMEGHFVVGLDRWGLLPCCLSYSTRGFIIIKARTNERGLIWHPKGWWYWNNCWRLRARICKYDNLYVVLYLHECRNVCWYCIIWSTYRNR